MIRVYESDNKVAFPILDDERKATGKFMVFLILSSDKCQFGLSIDTEQATKLNDFVTRFGA